MVPRRPCDTRGGGEARTMRGVSWALVALLALQMASGRASAQIVIVRLSTPPAALKLPAAARSTGAAASAQRVAHLGVASAAAAAEQSAFHAAAAATGVSFKTLHTYRYVSGTTAGVGCSTVECQIEQMGGSATSS